VNGLPQNAPGRTITERQAEAIRLRAHRLLDWSVVARIAKVDRGTLYRWRQTPAFQEALSAEMVRLDEESREKRTAAERVAWDALVDVAGDQHHKDRVKAADSILDRIGQVRGSSVTIDGTVGVAALSPAELAERRQAALERLTLAIETREE